MSKDNIQRFIQDIKVNYDLLQKLMPGKIANKLSFIEIANESGYDFTVNEWDEYVKAAAEEKNVKLSDDELDNVSGGWGLPHGMIPCQKQYNPLICEFFCGAFDRRSSSCIHEYFD